MGKRYITLAPGIISTIGIGVRKRRVAVIDKELANGDEVVCENCFFWDPLPLELSDHGGCCSMDSETRKYLGHCKDDYRIDAQNVIFKEVDN